MSHALVTIIAPLAPARLSQAEALIDQLGNPPRPDLQQALDRRDGGHGTHFCSLHALPSKTAGRAYLALELSADGSETDAIARLAGAIGADLTAIFALAEDWRPSVGIAAYLTAHRITTGAGLFDHPGLAFAGTPGLSVGRILDEQRLARQARDSLAALPPGGTALDRLRAVRETLADPLLPETAPPASNPLSAGALLVRLASSFVAAYLWPLLAVLALLALADGATRHAADAAIVAVLHWLAFWLAATIAAVTALALGVYARLRVLERRDVPSDRAADAETLAALFQRENHGVQNHMLSLTERKPGWVRGFTVRLAFWLIGQLAAYQFPPGFLGEIGTIHFARWVTVPGTRDLLFFSNYDLSWESYLEDFITRAHAGLTGIWSNSVGFPRTANLFQQGATDGERFKRYARQSMRPTRFWYSAYPSLTTTEIRTNTAIRQGLYDADTEDAAIAWMALFGSAARPAGQLVTPEIQSILFGGLGRDLPFGAVLFHALPPTIPAARAWLRDVLPHIGFDDARPPARRAIVSLALGPDGLQRLGLPEDALATFPYAFLTGPTDEARARILGDTGDNAADHWRWGRARPHAALLAYGKTAADAAALEAALVAIAAAQGATLLHRVPLQEITDDRAEPFGFTDGISQPVIRGTAKARKAADALHLVEPGEFILGYPDNRGNLPPGPISKTAPEDQRDLGRNGSYLVIRELEQDVEGFHAYCRAEAARLRGTTPSLDDMTPDFIAARLIGRWPSGASTLRHPTAPPARPNDPPDNDFRFGAEDPEALRCPFGAHIRRANPRDSLDPGAQEQIDISNRHRIIRIGRRYRPTSPTDKPGLLFMCLNGDIERQFEFVQQTWLRSPSFHGLSGEQDPLLGDGAAGGFTIPTRAGPIRLQPVPALVTTRGAGYFFVPGKRLLTFLASA